MTKSLKYISAMILFFFLFLHFTNGDWFPKNNPTLRDEVVEVEETGKKGGKGGSHDKSDNILHSSEVPCLYDDDCIDYCKSVGYARYKCKPKRKCLCWNLHT
uniref:Nodule-specific protein n=1 Tax=Astragalus sinicus TaxID=47065 RepID=Q07A23_ASTSI|nr:nodule-specific protein [Astragalus sinicus]